MLCVLLASMAIISSWSGSVAAGGTRRWTLPRIEYGSASM
jgi:hypothetical protein